MLKRGLEENKNCPNTPQSAEFKEKNE